MKKILVAMLSAFCLCFSTFDVKAAHNHDSEIQPYVMAYPCPECSIGVFREYTSRTVYGTDWTRTCRHGKSGNDLYRTYAVYNYGNCDTCGYHFQTKTTYEDVLLKCGV